MYRFCKPNSCTFIAKPQMLLSGSKTKQTKFFYQRYFSPGHCGQNLRENFFTIIPQLSQNLQGNEQHWSQWTKDLDSFWFTLFLFLVGCNKTLLTKFYAIKARMGGLSFKLVYLMAHGTKKQNKTKRSGSVVAESTKDIGIIAKTNRASRFFHFSQPRHLLIQ